MSSSWSQALYAALPAPLQDAAVTGYGWSLRRWRQGGEFRAHERLLDETERWDSDRLRAYQADRLREVLDHAGRTVPRYRADWSPEALAAARTDPFAVLERLPRITKEDVRESGGAFLSDAVPESERVWLSTSGTTGTPQRVAVDRRSRQQNYAYVARLLRRAGVSPNEWGAVFAGRVLGRERQLRRRPWRTDYANRCVLFSSYHLGESSIARYVAGLNRVAPAWVEAYPSAVWALARLAREHGLRLPRPKVILVSSESVGREQHEEIEAAFGCPVIEYYGMAEQAAFAAQCEQGRYHLHPEFGVVEFFPAGEDAQGTPLYELVATGFHNRAMPLVRYRTGDLVTLAEGRCECGSAFPLLGRIIGRHYDLIITPDGRRVAGIGPALKGLPLRESQLAQVALDAVELRVVPQPGAWDDDLARLAVARLRERLGPDLRIDVRVMEAIPRGANGKFRLILNVVHTDRVSGDAPALTR